MKSGFYAKELERSLKGISRVRAQIPEKGIWFFARQCPAHPAVTTKRFLANASVETSQQHYTTDIVLAGLSYSLR